MSKITFRAESKIGWVGESAGARGTGRPAAAGRLNHGSRRMPGMNSSPLVGTGRRFPDRDQPHRGQVEAESEPDQGTARKGDPGTGDLRGRELPGDRRLDDS